MVGRIVGFYVVLICELAAGMKVGVLVGVSRE